MLEQAITELQNIEKSVARKTLSDLKIHLALRSCLKQLRTLSVACPPAARGQLGYRSPRRFMVLALARHSSVSPLDITPHNSSLSCRVNREGDFRPVYVLQPKSP